MARMYGSVQGNRGEAHRLGHKSMKTVCATASGAIRCMAFIGPDNEDWVEIDMMPWQSAGTQRTIYRGPIGRFRWGSLGKSIDWQKGAKS